MRRSRYSDAEQLYQRTLRIVETIYGPNGRTVSTTLYGLGNLHFAQRQWDKAVHYWQRSTDVIVQRVARNSDLQAMNRGGTAQTEAEQEAYRFSALVGAEWLLAKADPARRQELARSSFKAAQWATGSKAAASLAQMAARVAATDTVTGQLVRERQDLLVARQEKDRALIAARSLSPDKRDQAAEAALGGAITSLDTRLDAIERQLASSFAGHDVLARPEVLAVEDMQALLGPDEALLLFLDQSSWKVTVRGEASEVVPERTNIWAITKADFRWVQSPLGTLSLKREVAALRCGLDLAAWYDEGAAKCTDLLGLASDEAPQEAVKLPFAVESAHALYRGLFGQVEDLVHGKHLLIVPSGALTQLPFHVLARPAPRPVKDVKTCCGPGGHPRPAQMFDRCRRLNLFAIRIGWCATMPSPFCRRLRP